MKINRKELAEKVIKDNIAFNDENFGGVKELKEELKQIEENVHTVLKYIPEKFLSVFKHHETEIDNDGCMYIYVGYNNTKESIFFNIYIHEYYVSMFCEKAKDFIDDLPFTKRTEKVYCEVKDLAGIMFQMEGTYLAVKNGQTCLVCRKTEDECLGAYHTHLHNKKTWY